MTILTTLSVLIWLAVNCPVPACVPALPADCDESDAHSLSGTVRIALEVRLSSAADDDSSPPVDVFVAGNLRCLGQWKPDGLRLIRSEDGVYRGEFLAAEGWEVEYKLTQGTWARVEKDGMGREIMNRRFTATLPEDKGPQRIAITVERWASPQPGESTITGTVILLPDFASAHLRTPRNITVWLPPGYGESEERYPVIYLQDGQNLFNAATAAFGVEWRADEAATELIGNQEIRPAILAGIWNTPDRINEYTMTSDRRQGGGGGGQSYVRFLADELKPFLDRTYRTLTEPESTLIGGSSLGGLISLEACLSRPEIFGGCIAMSPSLGWDDERLLTTLATGSVLPGKTRLWLSMGTHEGRDADAHAINLERARRLAALLKSQTAADPERIRFEEFTGATHSEQAWSVQFPDALRFHLAPGPARQSEDRLH